MSLYTFVDNRDPFKETGSYDEWKLYLENILPTDIVYDIGGNIGWMAHFFCQISKHVYSFEPDITYYPRLVKNTQNFKNINCFNLGISDSNHDNYVVISEFIQKNRLLKPDFIKLDIEGYESIIMKTFDDILKTARPIIYIEMHCYLNDFIFASNDGYDWNRLKDLNYKIKKHSWAQYLIKSDTNPHGTQVHLDPQWTWPYILPPRMDWNPHKGEKCNYLLFPE